MKTRATIKIKVATRPEFIELSEKYLKACQYACDIAFENNVKHKFSLHHLVYNDIRKQFNLKSQFTINAIAKGYETYKSSKKLKGSKPIFKSVAVRFDRRNSSFVGNNLNLGKIKLSLNIPAYYQKYLTWSYQTLDLIKIKKQFYLHIVFAKEINTGTIGSTIVGVDLGINNLAVCSDGQVFKTPKTKIKQFRYLRSKLQAKGTKSAMRLLKKLSGKQKRFMAWVNHNVSKSIISSADVIVLENLKGIRKQRKGKRFNRWLNNWSFYQLQQFISYKAEREGKTVDKVNPYLTSQTCSSCGKLGSRYFDFFSCPHCGLSLQSDFNASCNLRRLHITQPNVSDDEGKASIDDLRLSLGTKSQIPHALA